MKHIKRIHEKFSEADFDEIQENFLFINDEFGKPQITKDSWGNSIKWSFIWNLKLDLSKLNSSVEVANLFDKLADVISDIQSAANRLDQYSFDISITRYLKIEVCPKNLEDTDSFDFIDSFEYRTLYINKSEIERYFKKHGGQILEWDETFDEFRQFGDVVITYSPQSEQVAEKFAELFEDQLSNFETKLSIENKPPMDREFFCEHDVDYTLRITSSESEKTYVSAYK